MKARNYLFNIDGLGIAWYTSASSDFERGNTVSIYCRPLTSILGGFSYLDIGRV